MLRFGTLLREARRSTRREGARAAILPLSSTLDALGVQGWAEARLADVPVERIVGTVARVDDFDRQFRPRRRHLRERWERVARAGAGLRGSSPVQLIQLGELYFVSDGHHRVSVARSEGIQGIEAFVRRVCTVAYACHCLSVLDLRSKEAERRFLERFPLPDDVRTWLWLDSASDWALVERAARQWIVETTGKAVPTGHRELTEVVEAWWEQDVLPASHECDPTQDASLADYLCALEERVDDGACVC